MLAIAAACAGLLGGCGSGAGGERDQAVNARLQGDDEPACSDIEVFAEVLVDVRVDYDYSATVSPAELADTADTLLSGRLTGNVVLDSDLAPNDFDEQWYVGYEIRVDRVAKSSRGVEPGALYTVFVFYGSPIDDSTNHSGAASRAAGAPVVVFASDRGASDRPTALIEGFATSCKQGPLLGWRGDRGEWTGLSTVDEVFDAAWNGAK